MPICTTCTSFAPYLYTVYDSAYNLRLEQCLKCHSFVDPYVEHDALTLLLDLILLKRGVYRHLLYNRGTEPRRVLNNAPAEPKEELERRVRNSSSGREKRRWLHNFNLGAALVTLDAFIRWSYLNPNQAVSVSPWTNRTLNSILRVLLGCFIETVAFHLSTMLACYVALASVASVKSLSRSTSIPESDIKREFRFSLIPLTLFYSSFTKLFLLFLLTIWRPTSTTTAPLELRNGTLFSTKFFVSAFEILDDDKIDREWVVRNILGGMSAGFGLKVILDAHPLLTSLIILAGWKAKTTVAGLMSSWVGGDDMMGEAWRAYSIP